MPPTPTAAERLKALSSSTEVLDLKTALCDICAEFGEVTRIHILTLAEGDERKAMCFLQLESEHQERELISSLGASRFGSDVLLVVDLPR